MDLLWWVLSRLSIRLLAFNVLLVFLPAAGVLYLDTFETKLLEAQERSMVQQGRLLAAALSGGATLDLEEAQRTLEELRLRTTSRLRVLDANGTAVADSSQFGPRRSEDEGPAPEDGGARRDRLYRLGSWLFRTWGRLTGSRSGAEGPLASDEGDDPVGGAATRAALAGRYGASTSIQEGQPAVTLYTAIPIRDADQRVIGAVLVSQSTLRLLSDLSAVRLAVFRVVVASVVVAAILSLLVSGTIARPLRRLRLEAADLLDRRGRLTGRFKGSRRLDEIGDLARALQELSRRLAEHLRFVESFAIDVSHEFKNPLAAIRTATELLAEAETPESRRRFLDLALTEVARLEQLLGQVREITALDAELESERIPVPLGQVLHGLAEGARLRWGERVRFEVASTGRGPWVVGRPERIAQVFENLMENAAGFSPDGATVAVGVEAREPTIRVTVSDDGPGIPEEHLDRIFDRFFSYRPNEEERGHTGLGLAIVRTVVEGYGGHVTAENRPAGGARFTVELPATESPPEAASEPSVG